VHEVLVHFVGGRVGDPDCERRERTPERTQEQRSEDRVLGDVRGLPQHLVPGA
jgi:hypothetical protein